MATNRAAIWCHCVNELSLQFRLHASQTSHVVKLHKNKANVTMPIGKCDSHSRLLNIQGYRITCVRVCTYVRMYVHFEGNVAPPLT